MLKGRKRVERLPPRFERTLKALMEAEQDLRTTPAVREIAERLADEEGKTSEEAIRDLTSRVHKDLHEMHKLGLVVRLNTPTRCWRIRDNVSIDDIDWEALLM